MLYFIGKWDQKSNLANVDNKYYRPREHANWKKLRIQIEKIADF